jgi:hypothetical protein
MSDKKKINRIKDADVPISNFPTCVCVYQNGRDSYHLVEINTGAHIGSIKSIPDTRFSKLSDVDSIYSKLSPTYPLLKNYVVYNEGGSC